MKRLLIFLAQVLVCASVLGLPAFSMAEEPEAAPQEQPAEIDPNYEEQLAQELARMPSVEPGSDMKQALHDVEEYQE